MENYKEKYEEALDNFKKIKAANKDNKELVDFIEYKYPELKESEDERIRKEIIQSIQDNMCVIHKDKCIAWLEKQREQKPVISDDALREGIAHFGITQYQIDNWLKKYVDIKKQDEQKTDKVESKFKVGDWVIDKQGIVHQIANVIENVTCHTYGYDIVGGGYFNDNTEGVKLWTILDAKKGDILQANKCTLIFDSLTKDIDDNTVISSWYYCGTGTFYGMGTCKPDLWVIEGVVPATKEQRDLLFQKMKEAGYEWDDKKKELKKIEEEYDGEDYGIDSLFHAQRILEKTLGKVDGYQTDDGILSHKCAISAVKNLYKQKPTWSEEDEHCIELLLPIIDSSSLIPKNRKKCKKFLKSLKERMA